MRAPTVQGSQSSFGVKILLLLSLTESSSRLSNVSNVFGLARSHSELTRMETIKDDCEAVMAGLPNSSTAPVEKVLSQ